MTPADVVVTVITVLGLWIGLILMFLGLYGLIVGRNK